MFGVETREACKYRFSLSLGRESERVKAPVLRLRCRAVGERAINGLGVGVISGVYNGLGLFNEVSKIVRGDGEDNS